MTIKIELDTENKNVEVSFVGKNKNEVSSIQEQAELSAEVIGTLWDYIHKYRKYCENIDDLDKWYKFEEWMFDNNYASLEC
jgi:hypothetical protein